MKVLILQSKGKHKDNVEFRESLCMQRALNRIEDVESFVWGPGYPFFKMPFEKMVAHCDCILLLENYSRKPWIPDLSKVKKLIMFWSIDAHVVFARHKNTIQKNKIDIVLNSTGYYVKKFKGMCKKSIWYPNCYPSDLIKPGNGPKRSDLGFCGQYVSGRKKSIDELYRAFKIQRDIFILGQNMVNAICSYKIHFNKNYSRDINYRTFETLGCQTFLLTNETDRLKDLFEIGKHLQTYNSMEDCKEKIRYYLKHEDKRKVIEKAGYDHVLKNHTYDNRAETLLQIIKENI